MIVIVIGEKEIKVNQMALQDQKLLEETSMQWHSIRDEFPPETFGLGEA
jgi:hypothetical protein